MRSGSKCMTLLVVALICLSNSAPVKKPPTRLKKAPNSIQKFDPFVGVKSSGKLLFEAFSNNAVANVFKNTYSFFYWLPRRNIPFDTPWKLFGNSSSEWIAWYQLPHNLPPYIYLSEGQEPSDFFCWGLPGNTLPLGNWDPLFLQNTSPAVFRKYRESELKHGRLAMLSVVGFLVQESYHPMHEAIGGMAITHMASVLHLANSEGMFASAFNFIEGQGIPINSDIPLDYITIVLFLVSFEVYALRRNWTRWGRNEYDHQFVGNIGIGNLQDNYENGNYAFDPLRLRPDDPEEYRDMMNKELNNGRLAMIAITGMIVQEYFTGVPVTLALLQWLDSGGILELVSSPFQLIQAILNIPEFISQQLSARSSAYSSGMTIPNALQ